MANPSRYRYIEFYGGRILEAREVAEMQRIQEGLDSAGVNRVALDLNAIYREGATFNITPTLSSTHVTLTPTNSSLPMYVFVRGRWEFLQSFEIASPLTLSSTGGNVYLNWVIRQVTSSEDPVLVDTSTGAPTADMGELDLSVSNTDTSGVSLTSSQFEKNTQPIILYTYNSSNVLVNIDNVNSVALASLGISGLVSLTTSTSNGVAVAADDTRLTNSRPPSALSVDDASVRVPIAVIPASTNVDGTTVYNLTSDPGGINSNKIIHVPGSQLVSDVIEWLKGQFYTLSGIITAHVGARLGLSNTHPFPTAAEVGAAPLSHVGMQLGLSGSHPASVTANSGGFVVNRDPTVTPAANDPAFGLYAGSTIVAALEHTGDVYTALGATVTASPVGTTTTGALGSLYTTAKVLAEHVNQVSHANPHGLTAADLGIVFPVTIRNSYGTFVTTSDGNGGFIYEAWGTVNASTGGRSTNATITFPSYFPGTPVVIVSGGSQPASGQDSMSVYTTAISATGATVALECGVNIGGSGAPGFVNSVPVNWYARY